MANPRQRHKARSSSHKPVSNPRCRKKKLKKKPSIHGPKVLQEAWDKHKTVRQNYATLGLVHSLNPFASGGAKPLDCGSENNTFEGDNTASAVHVPTLSASGIPVGFGRLIRDEQGNVLQVELAEEGTRNDMDSLTPQMEERVQRRWVTEMGRIGDRGDKANIVIQDLPVHSTCILALEHLGSVASTKREFRYASAGERKYLQRLVDRHGMDLAAMSRDRRLNWEQRTEGELERGLRRCGIEKDTVGIRRI